MTQEIGIDTKSQADINKIRDECRKEARMILDENAYNFKNTTFGKKFNV